MNLDAATQQYSCPRFLCFRSSRSISPIADVVTAERYIAALTPAAEPVSADVVTFPVAKEEKLARAA